MSKSAPKVLPTGDKHHVPNGQLHPEDGPANLVESANGNKHYDREDGTAVECAAQGYKAYYLNGQLHREDGPTMEFSNGNKYYYRNGKLNREDGPAMEFNNGDKHYYRNDQLHREDGPATELANGDKEWWLFNRQLTESCHRRLVAFPGSWRRRRGPLIVEHESRIGLSVLPKGRVVSVQRSTGVDA